MKKSDIIFLILCSWIMSESMYGESRKSKLNLKVSNIQDEQKPIIPMSLDDALAQKILPGRMPIDVAPNGEWVAYTLQDPGVTLPGKGWSCFSPTGASSETLGCEVWITNFRSGKSQKISGDKGTSWGPRWSPDSRHLAFFSDYAGKVQLCVWDNFKHQAKAVSEIPTRAFFGFEVPSWTPDGKRILTKILPEGVEHERWSENESISQGINKQIQDDKPQVKVFQSPLKLEGESDKDKLENSGPLGGKNNLSADIALIDLETGNINRVAKSVLSYGYWISPDGRYVAYMKWQKTLPNTQQSIFSLELVNIESPESHKILVSDIPQQYGISASWSPDSQMLSYTTYGQTADGECYLVSIDGNQRKLTDNKHSAFGAAYRSPLWGPSGEAIFFVSDKELWKATVKDGALQNMTKDFDREVLEIVCLRQGRCAWINKRPSAIMLVTREFKTKQVGFHSIDPITGKSMLLIEEEKYYGSRPLFTTVISESKLIFVGEDSRHPQDIWLLDTKKKSVNRITNVNPHFAKYILGENRLIDWKKSNGETLQGVLLLPPDFQEGKKYPTIVSVYGGSLQSDYINRFGLTGLATDNSHLYATRGYVVFVPDIPMSRGKPIKDILEAVLPGVDRVINLGIADPDRIGVMGWSYGGYTTLALITHSNRFKAAKMGAGMGNLVSSATYGAFDRHNGIDGIGYFEKGQGGMTGTPWEKRQEYLENSPFFYLDRVQTPLLIVHGTLDSAVKVEAAEEVFVGLRRLCKEATFIQYLNEDHGIERYPNVRDHWERTIAWWDSYLKK